MKFTRSMDSACQRLQVIGARAFYDNVVVLISVIEALGTDRFRVLGLRTPGFRNTVLTQNPADLRNSCLI